MCMYYWFSQKYHIYFCTTLDLPVNCKNYRNYTFYRSFCSDALTRLLNPPQLGRESLVIGEDSEVLSFCPPFWVSQFFAWTFPSSAKIVLGSAILQLPRESKKRIINGVTVNARVFNSTIFLSSGSMSVNSAIFRFILGRCCISRLFNFLFQIFAGLLVLLCFESGRDDEKNR